MVKGNVKVFIFLFTLILIPLVNAVPPVTTTSNFPEGYSLIEEQQEALKLNQDYVYYFFVSNSTTGQPLTNTSVNCSFFIANSTSDLIVIVPRVTYNSSGFWEVPILGSNFSHIGEFPYGLSCFNEAFGGSLSGTFFITYTGQEFSEAQAILSGFLLIILVGLIISLVFFINQLPFENERDPEGQIISISYLKYLRSPLWFVEWMLVIALLYITSNLAFAFLSEELFAKVLFMIFQVMFALTPIIVIIWGVWFFVKFYHDREFQNLLNRGIFPQGRLP